MDKMDQKMLGNLLFWLEWVFPYITLFTQAHICRSRSFYYELALVSCVYWTHLCAELYKQQNQHDTISNNYSSGLAPKSLLTLAAAAKYVSQRVSPPRHSKFPLQKCSSQDLIPAKSLSLFYIPLNHHLATSKPGAPPRSLRHHPRLLRDHSGGEEPVQQQDRYLGRNWKEEIRG